MLKPDIPLSTSRLVLPVRIIWAWIQWGEFGIYFQVRKWFQCRIHIGWGFFIASIGFAFFVKRQLVKVVRGIFPFTKTTGILTSGPIHFLRNHMYLAMLTSFGLASFGIILGIVAFFVVIPLFIIWIRTCFIS